MLYEHGRVISTSGGDEIGHKKEFYLICYNEARRQLDYKDIVQVEASCAVDWKKNKMFKRFPIDLNSPYLTYARKNFFRFYCPQNSLTIISFGVNFYGLTFFCSFVKQSDLFKFYRTMSVIKKENKRKVYLNDSVKEKVSKFISSVKRTKRNLYGMKLNRGMLLSGHPGNGKTFLSDYIFESCNIFKGGNYNQTDLINAISKGMSIGSCLIDDISSDMLRRNHEYSTSLLSSLDCATFDNFCLRILTTNENIDDIDRAFLRPGRIDTVIAVENPNEDTRRNIFEDWKVDFDYNKEVAIKKTEDATYAELNYVKLSLIDNFLNGTGLSTENVVDDARNHIEHEKKRQMGFVRG